MEIAELVPQDFHGVISLVRGDQVLFRQAHGYADLANRIPNTIDTRFQTASAGKAFVAVGILQLVERGQLGLEDTIGTLLDLDLKAIDPAITVRQLLTHTSGIPDYFDESVMDEYADLWVDYPNYRVRTSRDLLPLFIDRPMMYPAGQKFQYNNTGFVVLGLIIEQVTGVPFDTYLRDNVFLPAGMHRSGYYELDRLPAGCANAYIYDPARDEYYTNIYSVDVKGTGAGGAFTTVPDLERFWQALTGGRLLRDDLTREMMSPQVDEGIYGYGMWLKRKAGGGVCPYFQGSDPGVSFLSLYDPEMGETLTLISNFGCNVWKLGKDILARSDS